LESSGFEVVPAATVNEALRLISTESFDVLLFDLHMPDAGDGFTVVNAMRHTAQRCNASAQVSWSAWLRRRRISPPKPLVQGRKIAGTRVSDQQMNPITDKRA